MPIALRLHLAADPDLCRDVASAFIDAVFASYVRGARSAGALAAPGSFAHPGAVNFMQRFGSNLGLNVHAHLLALDGVYVTDRPGGAPTFHPAPTLTDIEVARVHYDARQRIERVLRARGLLCQPGEDPPSVKGMDESLLPFLQAASAQSRVASGPDSESPEAFAREMEEALRTGNSEWMQEHFEQVNAAGPRSELLLEATCKDSLPTTAQVSWTPESKLYSARISIVISADTGASSSSEVTTESPVPLFVLEPRMRGRVLELQLFEGETLLLQHSITTSAGEEPTFVVLTY